MRALITHQCTRGRRVSQEKIWAYARHGYWGALAQPAIGSDAPRALWIGRFWALCAKKAGARSEWRWVARRKLVAEWKATGRVGKVYLPTRNLNCLEVARNSTAPSAACGLSIAFTQDEFRTSRGFSHFNRRVQA
jgi:hypothetical protein